MATRMSDVFETGLLFDKDKIDGPLYPIYDGALQFYHANYLPKKTHTVYYSIANVFTFLSHSLPFSVCSLNALFVYNFHVITKPISTHAHLISLALKKIITN